MIPDPTEEIRAIKRELAAKFDYDIHRIFADLQRQQRESGRVYVTLPPRPPRQQPTTSHVLPASNPITTSDSQQTNPAAG
jgi:hypothetical protein